MICHYSWTIFKSSSFSPCSLFVSLEPKCELVYSKYIVYQGSVVRPLPSYMYAFYTFKMEYGPRQANLVLIAYASSEGSGEPAHPRSLARTSAARTYKQ